ncbi:GNAT family N-acetyltransferase [Kineosporia sp. R_H_3]|uniref:GNAT family N-acetyltransferase n=1 Tax=Kineosporia sp. R_H_3 TaxID=1961848 RepID=UPI000B4BFB2D|nr:GNAT family N-acetyltransferase [Kineosporia sp. R_H_3]
MTTTKDGRPVELARDEERRQFTATVDGTVAALAEYMQTPELVVFTHTETDPAFEGQGVASALVRWALDDVRSRGYAVLPVCPFVSGWIGRHMEEYGDLLYTSTTKTVHD